MARGGARNRSGPPPDPHSGRSEQRAYTLTALPAEGFKGKAPKFPLPRRVIVDEWIDRDRQPHRREDPTASEVIESRELELWAWVWKTPQACAWSMVSQRWRWHTIAMWVRTAVICESNDATAADKNSLHRFADQIGLTTAGLAELGWTVAVDEVAKQRSQRDAADVQPKRERRLRSVGAE